MVGAALGLGVLVLASCTHSEPDPRGNDTQIARDTDVPPNPTDSEDSGRPITGLLHLEGPAPQNLLVISLDTLRRDRIGRYGAGAKTDFLDGFFRKSVVLDDHRSCSNWTYPGMLCGLTGQDVLDLNFIPMTNLGEPVLVPDHIRFLGDYLGDLGYQTSLVTANPLIGEKFGFSRAYQEATEVSGYDAQELTEKGLERLDELVGDGEDAPWFLHLHYLDPHINYNPPAEYLDALESLEPLEIEDIWKKDVWQNVFDHLEDYSDEEIQQMRAHLAVYYNGEVSFLDDQLAVLWSELETRGALDDTLVVIFSDHGEQFLDHGEILHHKHVYQEESDAVTAFWAQQLQPGVWTETTTHRDILPTIFTLLNQPNPTEVTGMVAGATLAPIPRYTHAIDEETGTQSVDFAGLRLIYHWDGRLELYDRTKDLTEEHDLYEPGSDTVRHLWKLLAPTVEALDALHPNASPIQPEL